MPCFLAFKHISKILLFLIIFFGYQTTFAQNTSKKNNKVAIKKHKINKKHKAKKQKFVLKNPEENHQPNLVFTETDYFLEIELTPQNCNNTIASKCFFADSLFEQAYFHPTTLHIFSNKILATQLTSRNNNLQKSYPKIINKNYSFITTNQNKISFSVFDGNITELSLSQNANEPKSEACLFADKLFLHQQLYANIKAQDIFFKIPNKSELKQLNLFEYNQQKYATLYSNQSKSWQTIDNLILCQNKSDPNSQNILWQKTFSQEQCSQKLACLTSNTAQPTKNCQELSNVDLETCFSQEKCSEVFEINKCQITKNNLNE